MIADAWRSPAYTPPRECTRPDGRPKRAWPTERMARRYARQVHGRAFRVYHCGTCDHWHTTTMREAA